LFTQVLDLMKKKAHLNLEGFYQIINIKASMNLGLSDELKSEFTNFMSVERPKILTTNIPDPNWVAGFVNGEGCFNVGIYKAKDFKLGQQVRLGFAITQHDRDLKLMELLINYLKTGKLTKYTKYQSVYLRVQKFSDIIKIIIPFFQINRVKVFEYKDWCEIAKLMTEDKHLTKEGLKLIKKIKSQMKDFKFKIK
jgi:hypothetical protein